mgnify:CR=1 FL=1
MLPTIAAAAELSQGQQQQQQQQQQQKQRQQQRIMWHTGTAWEASTHYQQHQAILCSVAPASGYQTLINNVTTWPIHEGGSGRDNWSAAGIVQIFTIQRVPKNR